MGEEVGDRIDDGSTMGVEVADRIKMVRRWVNLNGQMWVAVLDLRSVDLSGGGRQGCCGRWAGRWFLFFLKWLIDESKPCASNSSSY